MHTELSFLKQKSQGALLPIALMLTMLGGIFLAGFMAMSTMRSVTARSYQSAVQRRIALENSKALVTATSRANGFSGDADLDSDLSSRLIHPNGFWGGITTDEGWDELDVFSMPDKVDIEDSDVVYPLEDTSTDSFFPHNNTGLRPGYVFTSNHSMKKASGVDDSDNYFLDNFTSHCFLKSSNPCFNGDAWVYYKKPKDSTAEIESSTSSVRTNFTVEGRMVIRDPASFFPSTSASSGTRNLQHITKRGLYIQKNDRTRKVTAQFATDSTSSSEQALPLNFPATPSSSGNFTKTSGPAEPTYQEIHDGELRMIGNAEPEVTPPPVILPYSHSNTLVGIQQQARITAAAVPEDVYKEVNKNDIFGAVDIDPMWVADETISGATYRVLNIKLDHPELKQNIRIFNSIISGQPLRIRLVGQKNADAYKAAYLLPPVSIIVYSKVAPLPFPPNSAPAIKTQGV
jgi:hypothetical protein